MKAEIRKHVTKMVRQVRKEAGLFTQVQIADILGLSRVAYVNIEYGRQHLSLDKLYVIACLHGKSISYFFPPLVKLKVKSDQIKVVKFRTKYKSVIIK